MVEGTPLLREHTPKGYRRFKSSRLRQYSLLQCFNALQLDTKPATGSSLGGFFVAFFGTVCLLHSGVALHTQLAPHAAKHTLGPIHQFSHRLFEVGGYPALAQVNDHAHCAFGHHAQHFVGHFGAA